MVEDRTENLHSASVLTNYYSKVELLRVYLSAILQTSEFHCQPETEAFANLLSTTYVGVKKKEGVAFRMYSTMLNMREVCLIFISSPSA